MLRGQTRSNVLYNRVFCHAVGHDKMPRDSVVCHGMTPRIAASNRPDPPAEYTILGFIQNNAYG